MEGPSIIYCEPGLCEEFKVVRTYPSLRLVAALLHGSAGLRVLGPGSVEHHSRFGEQDFLESLV